MAPVGMQVLGWAALRSLSPELILASLLGLIALIKFLTICTDCKRQGYVLDHPESERPPSNVIRVVQMEEAAMSRDNPGFVYSTKDEQVLRPAPENGSLHMSASTGDVWYTPWRTHSTTSNHQDQMSGIINHDLDPANSISQSPANNSPSIPTPSGGPEIPHLEEVSTFPSSHPRDTPMEHVQSLWQSETQEVKDGLPESSAHSLHQQWPRALHTYESLEDIGTGNAEEGESSGYQTVEEFNASTPFPSDHMQVAGSGRPSPPTVDRGQEEGVMGMGMYAQVSKKHKSPTNVPQQMTVWGEPVPVPQLPLSEEEEPAPPVPYRNFEMLDRLNISAKSIQSQ